VDNKWRREEVVISGKLRDVAVEGSDDKGVVLLDEVPKKCMGAG
jgi:hypothetical protein